ncbi:MAG: hypothetical protein V2A66_01215 [Pseudomonadota bacterium]
MNPLLLPTISPAGIAGWDAVSVANQCMSFIVAGEAARLWQYSLAPYPAAPHGTWEEMLYTSARERGRIYAATGDDTSEFHNFGGVRTDVAPQGQWRDTPWGRDWPPPPALNSPRTMVVEGGNAIRLEAHDPDILGLKLATRFESVPSSSLVRVTPSMTNMTERPRTWANWIIVQLSGIAGASRIFIPPSPASKMKLGYTVLMGDPAAKPISGDTREDVTKITYTGNECKLGFDGRSWIAARQRPYHASNGGVFALQAPHNIPGAQYPDGGSSIQLYTGIIESSYYELEATGSLVTLAPGEHRADEFLIGAARCAGDVTGINTIGITCAPLALDGERLTGSFGVFFEGRADILQISRGRRRIIEQIQVSPLFPAQLDVSVQAARGDEFRIEITDRFGSHIGLLANFALSN